MRTYNEYESDGWFYLTAGPGGAYYDPCTGDLGRGGGVSVTRFKTAEARVYYRRSVEAQESASRAADALESFKRELLACLLPSGRFSRKRLLALVEKANTGEKRCPQ